jgi:aspartate-semialdehyde dehydrogenase
MEKHRVGILGATGLVGQRLVERLEGHPWFELAAVGASERSRGKRYAEAARWIVSSEVPRGVADRFVTGSSPHDFADCDVVLSALDAATARSVEPALVEAGLAVVSNSSAFRMSDEVPLIVPEVNASHAALVEARRGRGFLVTNPNCSTTGLVLALAPLHRRFGVRRVVVATLQALSGAGMDGPRGLDVVDNVIPFIAGEEEKIESEVGKILGSVSGGRIAMAQVTVSAHCHRVPTLDGHLEAVSAELERRASPDEVREALETFSGEVADLGLPSAPFRPILVREQPDRPQPRLDRDAGGGMSAVVGRIRPCPVLSVRLEVLSHNAVRGAAGGTLLNAELLAARGLLPRRRRS